MFSLRCTAGPGQCGGFDPTDTAAHLLVNFNFNEMLWTELAREARTAATQLRNLDLKLQVLAEAARYRVLARLVSESHGWEAQE